MKALRRDCRDRFFLPSGRDDDLIEQFCLPRGNRPSAIRKRQIFEELCAWVKIAVMLRPSAHRAGTVFIGMCGFIFHLVRVTAGRRVPVVLRVARPCVRIGMLVDRLRPTAHRAGTVFIRMRGFIFYLVCVTASRRVPMVVRIARPGDRIGMCMGAPTCVARIGCAAARID